jgi:enoyl-CoA hydratase
MSGSWQHEGYRAGMTPRVTHVRDGSVAVLRMDDGKVNAVNDAMLDELDAALDAAAGARAIVLAGRDGVFSGGFDLSVVGQGGPAAEALVHRGGQVLARLYQSPVPVVVACTGHAVALGAVMLLATDMRVGPDADVAIGLNEVAIGMPLPELAVALAQERLAAPLRRRAVVLAEMWTPVRAVDVGFLDEVVAPESVVATAIDRAKDLGTRLQPDAYATTSQRLRTTGTDLLQA